MTPPVRVWSMGEVGQIDPAHDARFGGCFLIVTDVKMWGVQGYVTVPGDYAGRAFYRVEYEYIRYIGVAEWDVEPG